MIPAGCRTRLTSADVGFVLRTLRPEAPPEQGLLREAVSLDDLLDRPEVFRALTAPAGLPPVSQELFFYVVVRRYFREEGLRERDLADYVSTMLVEYGAGRRMYRVTAREGEETETLVDLLRLVREVEGGDAPAERREREAYVVYAHIGNYALFLTGVFPDRVFHRTHARGAPPLSYYEDMGASSYRAASALDPAYSQGLHEVLYEMSESFHPVRVALNRLSDEVFHLSTSDPINAELRRILYRPDR